MSHTLKIPSSRAIRLKEYHYSQAGAYFVTICCCDGVSQFGTINHDEMQLNEYGQIAYNQWLRMPTRYPDCDFEVFLIIPNHLHAIIVINDFDNNAQETTLGSLLVRINH